MMKIEHEKYTLFQGDCFEVLKTMPDNSVDAIITDIPYDKATACSWDVFDIKGFSELLRVAKGVITFANFKIASRLYAEYEKHFRYELIWQKTRKVGFLNANRQPMNSHEYILIFGKPDYTPQKYDIGIPYNRKNPGNYTGVYSPHSAYTSKSNGERHPGSVLSFKPDHDATISTGARNRHPTQKPLSALEWLVKSYTKPGDLVLDPFCGSGTTGVACMLNDRRFIGIEKEHDFFDMTKNRIEKSLCPGEIFKALPN